MRDSPVTTAPIKAARVTGGAWARRGEGFTLIETLVAVFLAALIAGGAAVAVAQSLKAREASRARQEAASRAGAAVASLADDALNLIRSGDLFDARVLLVDGATAGAEHDELLLFTGSTRRVRPGGDQNEGGIYEVQYRLETPADARAGGYTLWRRADPAPDHVPDGGGVAWPIVEGIVSLSIEAFDGAAWNDSWDSDRDGYPHAIRVTVGARADDKPAIFVARRVAAIDRTPRPYAGIESAGADGGTTR